MTMGNFINTRGFNLFLGDRHTHTYTWSSDVLKRMSRSTYEVNPGGLFQVAPVQCDDSGAAVDAAQLVCSCTGWWLAMFTVLN